MNLVPCKPFSRSFNALLVSVAVGSLVSCSSGADGSASGSGGSSAAGQGSGGNVNGSGGSGLAGSAAATGGSNSANTSAPTGGNPAATGGRTGATGGSNLGGTAAATGGSNSGGTAAATGGSNSGGTAAATGGSNSGGTAAATGGRAAGMGGTPTATGGSNSGGTAATTGGSSGVVSGCDATTTPVARHGKLSVKGNRIVNECGRPVTLRGMSLYDWNQQGRQFYNANAVKNLAQQKKCTLIRIPLLAANYPGSMDRVKTVMDACVANGIYCMPNWHVIGASNADAATPFYVALAQAYGNTPNIIYEPWNEPTTDTWATIKAYHEKIIAAVRPIDPDNIFLLGNRQWDQRPDEACNDPVTSTSNVGYVFHFYANTLALSSFKANIDTCLNKGFSVFVTEYGGVSSSGSGTFNTAEMQNWWNYMDANYIGSANWAVESNTETSSVFTTTANINGPWQDSEITNSGTQVFQYIASKYDETMSQ